MTPAPDDWDAVFFDIGGVLVNLPSIRAGYAAYLQEFAAEYDLDPEWAVETWRETLGEYFAAAKGTEYRPAHAGYEQAFQALVEEDLSEDDWAPGFREATTRSLEPEPNAVETIRALFETGLYLGIISDVDTREADRMLDQFGIRDAFDGITTSEDVGRKKPDPAMFEDALRGAPVDPGRSLYVGDRYEHDMEGGTAGGLRTVAYGGPAAEAVEKRDGYRVQDDDAIDFVIDDLSDLLEIVGARA